MRITKLFLPHSFSKAIGTTLLSGYENVIQNDEKRDDVKRD